LTIDPSEEVPHASSWPSLVGQKLATYAMYAEQNTTRMSIDKCAPSPQKIPCCSIDFYDNPAFHRSRFYEKAFGMHAA
jgi:hypothetical protein